MPQSVMRTDGRLRSLIIVDEIVLLPKNVDATSVVDHCTWSGLGRVGLHTGVVAKDLALDFWNNTFQAHVHKKQSIVG